MSTRDRILAAFHNRPGKAVSGIGLAKQLGLSRTAIWKQIRGLRQQGIPIESDAKTGYRFSGPPDLSLTDLKLPRSLNRWLQGHYEISCSSTQEMAKAGAHIGLPEGHFWISETQTSGRGRLMRVWESPFGGLWFSVLLRPSMPAGRVPPLTLVAAVALAESAGEMTQKNIYLKWPNDLVVWRQGRWKKIAGLLTEMSGETDRTDWVAMGIGINVNNDIPPHLKEKAMALNEVAGKLVPRAELLIRFFQKFRTAYLKFQREGFEPFQQRYWALYGQANRSVRILASQGEINGTARGVDPVGRLIVESRRLDSSPGANRTGSPYIHRMSGRKKHYISEGEIVLE